MIGNNSCGATAQLTGKVIANIAALEVLLYDGTQFRCGITSDEEYTRIERRGDRRAEIYRRLRRLRDHTLTLAELLTAHTPAGSRHRCPGAKCSPRCTATSTRCPAGTPALSCWTRQAPVSSRLALPVLSTGLSSAVRLAGAGLGLIARPVSARTVRHGHGPQRW
jgi:hypothetical protein